MTRITNLYDELVRLELARCDNPNTIVSLLNEALQRRLDDWHWHFGSLSYTPNFVCPVCGHVKDDRVSQDRWCYHAAARIPPSVYERRKAERAARKAVMA